ncbi:MAG: 3-alpha-hydroxycholanate dehydrogenase (NADP(+)) [Turneriella sp.]|nr:3-alpha-hydroxycholanate dehydrogenase (NADP(+)) [Turneriella sp.]
MKKIDELLSLKGQTAIVTGGARGIGYRISARLAEAGANVVVADISQQAVDTAVAQLKKEGYKVSGTPTDVGQERDVDTLIAHTTKEFGTVDILVNNAGIFPSKLVMQMSKADFDKVIQTNLGGVFLCTKKAAAQMITQGKGGKIINITSIDALHPSQVGLAHYDASKHGVWGFTKNVALELAPHKIWVNALAPGGVATEGVQEMSANVPAGIDMAKVMEGFLAKIPMHRMGDPDEIAKATLFLASDMASYMTGSHIVVDGGALLT